MSLPTEEWRPIPGFEGKYDVSSHGRFRSWVYAGKVGAARPMTPTLNDDGYYRVTLSLPGKRYYRRVHVWVALAFLGPRPDGLVTRHLDGDATNNHVSNLQYGTAFENAADQRRHGTHYNAKKTHCPRGHAYDIHRVLPAGHNQRQCRRCQRASMRGQIAPAPKSQSSPAPVTRDGTLDQQMQMHLFEGAQS